MDIPNDVLAIFTSRIKSGGNPGFSIPEQELEIGELEVGEKYRIAVLPPAQVTVSSLGKKSEEQLSQEPPVEEGETREVEIEDIGEQEDGITRVERGFVVIVPDTDQGERVTVEIADVSENVAFAEVVERPSFYE